MLSMSYKFLKLRNISYLLTIRHPSLRIRKNKGQEKMSHGLIFLGSIAVHSHQLMSWREPVQLRWTREQWSLDVICGQQSYRSIPTGR